MEFKTLPGVISTQDAETLSLTEELALIIGLAAKRVRDDLERDEETLYINTRRLAVLGVVTTLIVAALGTGWALSQGRSETLPWIFGAAVLVLLLVAGAAIFAPRSERFGVAAEHAAVTRVSLLHWPVGILPLSRQRSVLWDPLTPRDDPLRVLELPDDLGIAQARALQSADEPEAAFHLLLAVGEILEALHPQPVRWPGNDPDPSAQALGDDVRDLWQRMVPLLPDELDTAVGFASDSEGPGWPEIAAAGERLYRFYSALDPYRQRLDAYRERIERMVDDAREVVVEYGWATINEVQNERARHFSAGPPLPALDARALPTAPDERLLLTPSDSAAALDDSLGQLAHALAPLDEAVRATLHEVEQEEEAALAASARHFAEQRAALADDEARLATLDSDVLKLAETLDAQQRRLDEQATQIDRGFRQIADVPLATLQREIETLHATIQSANDLIGDVADRIDLPGVEVTLAALDAAVGRAQTEWHALAEMMPARGDEVRARVEHVLETLDRLEADPEVTEADALGRLQASIRDIERVARTVVNWTAGLQNPLDPLEDHDDELADHLAALRDQRARLEAASATLEQVSGAAAPDALVTLPAAIERVERALAHFGRLADDTRRAVTAMTNAAETTRKQAEVIARLLDERAQLRQAYQTKLAQLREAETAERDQIREQWESARRRLQDQRATLDTLADAVTARLAQVRQAPELRAMGLIADERATDWPDVVANHMGYGIDLWGQRVAGIDGAPEDETVLARLRRDLDSCHEAIRARAVPTVLADDTFPLEPQICFVPFWYVETENDPRADKQTGRRAHLFPPLHLDRATPTDLPRPDRLRYEALTRRLLRYLRRDYTNDALSMAALSFDPAVLTEAGQRLDLDRAAIPLRDLASALAQHWVFVRMEDPLINRIIQNSRDLLIPRETINEAQLRPTQRQPALPEEGSQAVALPPDEQETRPMQTVDPNDR